MSAERIAIHDGDVCTTDAHNNDSSHGIFSEQHAAGCNGAELTAKNAAVNLDWLPCVSADGNDGTAAPGENGFAHLVRNTKAFGADFVTEISNQFTHPRQVIEESAILGSLGVRLKLALKQLRSKD